MFRTQVRVVREEAEGVDAHAVLRAACSSALAITKLVYASGRMRNASPTHLNDTCTRS